MPRPSLKIKENSESLVSEDSMLMKNGIMSQRTMPLLDNSK